MVQKTKRNKKKLKRKQTRKRKRNNKKFMKDRCSPKLDIHSLPFTCYTKNSLHKLKEIWNIKHPQNKIKSNDDKVIWQQLKHMMSNMCNRESCWLNKLYEHEGLKEVEYDGNFAPIMPNSWHKKPTTWLDSNNIINVMKGWENKCKQFQFIGPSPINYDEYIAYGECVWDELCNFNLEEMLNENIMKIGIIFNLDTHDKPGSHWVAMFINNKKQEIYYFDSYGDNIPRRIKKFANKVILQGKKLNKKYVLKLNKTRHQYSDSECGMYSLYFITELIKGKPFSRFNRKIKDKHMKKLRKIYFNKM